MAQGGQAADAADQAGHQHGTGFGHHGDHAIRGAAERQRVAVAITEQGVEGCGLGLRIIR